jgi:hypothetical protein
MPDELTSVLKHLTTPERIQDFLDSLPYNYEKDGETCSSPLVALRRGSIHCLEGAFIAAAALAYKGERPLILNLLTASGDQDHAVTLFKRDGYWGAVSKTNHAVLQFRDPVYRTLRELALSYFHEYFLSDTGRKTLRAYSAPFSLTRFRHWMTDEKDLWEIAYALRDTKHHAIAPPETLKNARRATTFVRTVSDPTEWAKSDPRT